METKLQKMNLIYYNLLIVQDLWQAHYQILSIIFLKEFIKFNLNMDMKIKKCEICGIKYKYCDNFKFSNFKGNLIECKCLCCNKKYQYKFDKKLKELFFNTYKFSNYNNKKFVLLLRKGVYPHEYMDDWEKFTETSLPEKEDFYSH